MKTLLFLFTFLAICLSSSAQNDSTRAAELIAKGQKFARGRVIVWVAKDSLSPKKINDILDTLNLGVTSAAKYIKAPHGWQVFGDKPVTFFLCNDDFVPHASADGSVFMPRKRFEVNRALWFHEMMHVLLRTKAGNWNNAPQKVAIEKMPMWLTEGLPEYIAMRLSHENKFARYDAWQDGGYLKADSSCAAKLRGEKGPRILNFIGKAGVLIELFGKTRPAYAPTFYNCACSFTKFIVDQYGIDVPLQAIAKFGDEEKTIETLTSKDLLTLKGEWLSKIGYEQ